MEVAAEAEEAPRPPSPAEQAAATPSIQPAGGTLSAEQTVSMADGTAGATIHYTTDGSTPTAASPVYSAPFSLNSAATIKAMARAAGYSNSSVASSAFSFCSPAGSYSITVNVTATPAGTTKSLSLSPVILTSTVN